MDRAWLSDLKFVHHLDRYRACLESIAAPITLEVDPTNRCDCACVWCTDQQKLSPTQLPFDLLRAVLRDAAAIGVRSVVFKGGGEPALYPHLADAVLCAAQAGLGVGLVTNGYRLSAAQLAALAAHASWVRVSLDAADADVYARVHRPPSRGAWERLQQVLEQLAASPPVVGATLTLSSANFHQVPAVYRLAADLGLDYLLVRPPFDHPPFSTPAQLAAAEEAILTARAQEISSTALMAPPPGALASYYHGPPARCRATPLVASLGADGRLYACCSVKGLADFEIADLNQVPLATAWGSPAHVERIRHLGGPPCAPHCTNRLANHNRVLNFLSLDDPPHVDFA